MNNYLLTKRLESGIEFLDSVIRFIRGADKLDKTIIPAEWLGLYYTVVIINVVERSAEETTLLMRDLLTHTLMEHRKDHFDVYSPVCYKSTQYEYRGMTILHPYLQDAIDFTDYLQNQNYLNY